MSAGSLRIALAAAAAVREGADAKAEKIERQADTPPQ